MKLLHLLSQRPNSTGSGFYVQAIAREAIKSGHENFLVAGISGKSDTDTGLIPKENCEFIRFEGDDLPFPIPGMSDVMPYNSKRFMDLTAQELDLYKQSFTKAITHAVTRFKPDIIHSNHLWLMTSIARKLFPKIPLITSCHGTDIRQLKSCKHLKARVTEGCSRVDQIIALSNSQKKEISELYRIPAKRIHIAGSGFNDKLFSYSTKPRPHPVNILYAGKLSRAKGVIWLLESLEDIMDLPFHLYLAGSGAGPEKEKCLQLAESYSKKVTVCGALKQEELALLMKQSHIFILPSFFEGLPLVLFEALASGCKVLTTALAGAKEIAEEAGSELVRFIDLPPLETVDSPFESDMPMLKKQLAYILRHEIAKTQAQANMDVREIYRITKKYTWIEVYKRIESVYKLMSDNRLFE